MPEKINRNTEITRYNIMEAGKRSLGKETRDIHFFFGEEKIIGEKIK